MKRLVAIDLSRAYLLARHNFEARKVLGDEWLSIERRCRATAIYIEIGKDFNNFFLKLGELPVNMWHKVSVHALETFRDNLDMVWMFSYGSTRIKIKWLTK